MHKQCVPGSLLVRKSLGIRLAGSLLVVEARSLLMVEAVPPSLPLVEEYSPKSIHGLKAKVFVCRGGTR